MTTALGGSRLAIGRATLTELGRVLEREVPDAADRLLREVGFSAGQAAYEGFAAWVADRYGVAAPEQLDARYLSEGLTGFFRDEGWGAVKAEAAAPGLYAIDAAAWPEARPGQGAYPACHLSSGMLSDFFTRLGGRPAAVLEVECRTRGDEQCRFLIGSPELMNWFYEGLATGATPADMIRRART